MPLSFGMTCLLSWLAMQVPLGLTVAYVLFKAGRRSISSKSQCEPGRAEPGIKTTAVVDADAA